MLVDELLKTNDTLKSEQSLSNSLNEAVDEFDKRSHTFLEADLKAKDFGEYSLDLHFEYLDESNVEELIRIIKNLTSLG